MPQGVQVFRANGTTQVEISDRLTRVTGIVSVAGAGSVTVDTAKGTPWGVFLPTNQSPYARVSVSGDTISYNGTGTLIYGVY